MWHQAWPQNDLLLLKAKTLKLCFCKVHLIFILSALKMLKTPNFDVTLFEKKLMTIKYIFLWHQAWLHNDLLLLKTKLQLLHHTYLWPPLKWHNKAMDKGKIEAMATKFSEKFAIIMLKKHRKFCRRGLTHLDATPIFKKSSGSFWDTL